ncbi:glycosyltransferase family 39 protein [Micromonospora olivasterospora]|uniref:Dolichyl-phosphate-mannose-protein mannosyltransferase n=1 Tax=Micromonospora olivasterospora TaxID=1880 RepID=A0A562IKB7_MICOL|nr:glycosyltransferase family 39 protein [Micromonospora olivasterospora]TWH71054.1 dolichyl-phosphate-mannose-protein mannosyltransferase [Micromonospora olivasterospora]
MSAAGQGAPAVGPPGFSGRKALAALVALVLAAGVVLRFCATSPLWLDEAQSVAIARLPLPELFAALRGDGAPPLYYLLLHGWMGMVGTGDWAVRSLSGLFATAALPLWYVAARRSNAGLVTLVLAAGNPWLVRYATEARPYTLVILLVLLGVLALEGVRRRPGPVRALGLAIVAGLLLLTHYWALFLYAVVGVGLLVSLLRERSRAAWWSLVGLAAGAVPFLPWLPTFLYQNRHTGTPWTGRSGIQVLLSVVTEWSAASVPPATALALVTWPLMTYGAVADGRRARLIGGTGAATLLLAVAVAWLTGSAVVTRYAAVVLPLAVLVLGVGAALLPRLWTALVVAGLTISWLAVDAVLVTRPRTDAAVLADLLNRQVTDADTVVFCPDQLGPDVIRRLRHRPRLLSFPEQKWPGRLDWTDYRQRIEAQDPAGLARQVAAGRDSGAVWLIPRYGFRPFGDRCQQLGTALAKALGPPQQQQMQSHGGSETVWRWAPL